MTLLFSALLLLLPIVFLLKKKSQHVKLPPSPPKLPIIGNLHLLGPLPHQSYWKLSKKYGEVMLLQFGRVRTVVISSAEAAIEVLKTHDHECCSRPPLVGLGRLSYNYLDISFAPYGDYWRQIRKVCVLEFFGVKKAQSFRDIREEEVASMISSISQASSSGKPVDLTEKLFFLTGSIIFRMAFRKPLKDSDCNNERFGRMIRDAMEVLGSFAAAEYFPYVGWIIDWLSGLRGKTERSFGELDRYFQQVVENHLTPERAKQGHPEDLVDVLIGLEKEEADFGGAPLNKDSIKAVVMNLFLAGIDTSAATVNWAMAELARNPRVMKKVQDEVRSLAGSRHKINEDDISELEFPYLKMVIKETLRLHSPAPLLLPREAMSHIKIKGYDIFPKTVIQVNVWAIGRDASYWKNPDEFYPDRFIGSSIDYKGQNYELLPFGSGRRICPGMHLATKAVELALTNLLLGFDWKLPFGIKAEDLNMEEEPGLTVSKDKALYLLAIDKFADN